MHWRGWPIANATQPNCNPLLRRHVVWCSTPLSRMCHKLCGQISCYKTPHVRIGYVEVDRTGGIGHHYSSWSPCRSNLVAEIFLQITMSFLDLLRNVPYNGLFTKQT